MQTNRLEQAVRTVRSAVENNEHIPQDDLIKELKRTYPKLYEMICKRNCDKGMLNKLLELQTGVRVGNIDQQVADETFGQVAADKYVMPIVNAKGNEKV
jgi:hypothetical protein